LRIYFGICWVFFEIDCLVWSFKKLDEEVNMKIVVGSNPDKTKIRLDSSFFFEATEAKPKYYSLK
jgi:hypothetical protein